MGLLESLKNMFKSKPNQDDLNNLENNSSEVVSSNNDLVDQTEQSNQDEQADVDNNEVEDDNSSDDSGDFDSSDSGSDD